MKNMNKKTKETKQIPVTPEGAVKISKTRKDFLKLIEAYKKKNPVKYEQKREALEKHLATL